MTDAIVTVFALFVVVSYSSFIAYDSSDKSLRFALGIMMLSALISSLASFSVGEILPETNGEDSSELSELYSATAEQAFADGVELALVDKFALSRSDLSVEITELRADCGAKEIKLTLSGRAAFADTGRIRDYLIENGLCDSVQIKIFGSDQSRKGVGII